LYRYVLNASRMVKDCVDNASIAMCENAQCYGASVASEQQHKQDYLTRVHCANFYRSALHGTVVLFRVDSSKKVCSDLPVKRCEGDRA